MNSQMNKRNVNHHVTFQRHSGDTLLIFYSVPHPLDDTLQALVVESSHAGKPQDPKEIHFSAVQHVVITAGFHVVIQTDGAECQTSNKPVHVDQAVVKWTEPILLYVVPNLIFPARIEKDSRPCNASSKVRVSAYASFELGPMLSHREVLLHIQDLRLKLLDRSGKVISLATSFASNI
ncbi:hypothetical protein DFJ58DRAFT_850264 [Suillus subalutaceus]|uniref:uncharacterized protein n=1 Tax=Suillus subalutaceus TaxID=48586 RepID=UPI001B8837D5|nr:uncharacterized protein DFJ58DRAFT_850264 [Suillus subalutaceus]KAG1818291.1 hypothetical protein DFJ58DRAFT_850264 [Suillus subalutaceus]